MTWLVENPWPAVIVGLAVQAGLAVLLVRSGRVVVLAAMAAAAALTAALVLLELGVVTEREKIEEALFGAAAAVESNDLPALLAHVSPSAGELRAMAEATLAEVRMTEARITGDLEISVNELTLPVSARATFIGRASGDVRRGGAVHSSLVSRFDVKLAREGDRWLIQQVERRDLR